MLVLQKIESSGLDGGGTLPGLCRYYLIGSTSNTFTNLLDFHLPVRHDVDTYLFYVVEHTKTCCIFHKTLMIIRITFQTDNRIKHMITYLICSWNQTIMSMSHKWASFHHKNSRECKSTVHHMFLDRLFTNCLPFKRGVHVILRHSLMQITPMTPLKTLAGVFYFSLIFFKHNFFLESIPK